MQTQRSRLIPDEQRRCVEAAVLGLALAEDWPWRACELARRLRLPVDAITLASATLRADGLLVMDGEKLRASWAAVRGDELAGWGSSIKRLARASLISGAAIPLL